MSKYKVINVEKFQIGENNKFACSFKDRKLMGCGSSLSIECETDREIDICMLTDRGPNMIGPKIEGMFGKIFLIPEFTPQIIKGKLKGGKLEIVDRVKLRSADGNLMTGIPCDKNMMGEIPLNSKLEKIDFDKLGIDPEGLSIGCDNNIWICEEYGPSVIKFDSAGKEIFRLKPGKGLPEKYKNIYPNRGFEAIAVSEEGNIFVAVQSVLNDGKERFIRLLKIDGKTNDITEYAYKFDEKKYNKDKDAKIGDIFAISDSELIIVEQGKCKKSENETGKRAIIYKIYLGEQVRDEKEELKYVDKEFILDLASIGWNYYKTEGITVTEDGQSILIINDNDFSIDARTCDEKSGIGVNIAEFEYDGDSYKNNNGDKFSLKTKFIDTEEKLELWRIRLDKSLNIAVDF